MCILLVNHCYSKLYSLFLTTFTMGSSLLATMLLVGGNNGMLAGLVMLKEEEVLQARKLKW